MSYADQRGMLKNALAAAGLDSDSASNIANILANSVQDALQSGRTRTDTTPEGLRMVGPDDRKLVFQNLDFRASDPDHRAQRTTDSEQDRRPQQAPNITERIPPQQTDATYRVSGGKLSDASGAGDSVEVNVRSRIAKQPPGKLPMTMMDRQSNTLVGKSIRASAGGDEGRARLSVDEGPRDVSWNLQLDNVARYRVITGIEYEPGVGLRVQYSTIAAWDERKKETRFLHMTEQQVLTEVVDDLKGPRAHTAYIPTFRSQPRGPGVAQIKGNIAEDLFFNTFRVGTFTGGWDTGETKTVTQVWPQGGRQVQVYNSVGPVANTPSTKTVLFAVRTPDAKATEEVRGEDENPLPLNTPPETDVKNWAIEIQPADECYAFSSLNGLRLDELAGYDSDAIQALSHDSGANACLSWKGESLEVVTNVEMVGSEVVVTKRPIHILKMDDETQATLMSFSPVTALGCFSFDDTTLTAPQTSFYALNPAAAGQCSDTLETVNASVLDTIYDGGDGIYATYKTVRVLGQQAGSSSKVVSFYYTTAAQCLALNAAGLYANTVTFKSLGETGNGACPVIPVTDCPTDGGGGGTVDCTQEPCPPAEQCPQGSFCNPSPI